MKKRKAAVPPGSRAQSSAWEYRVVVLVDPAGLSDDAWGQQIDQQLGHLGAEGWEVCAQLRNGRMVFKRPR